MRLPAGEGPAGRACDLVEAILVPGAGEGPPGAPSWGLVVEGERLGRRIPFDRLPSGARGPVLELLGMHAADPYRPQE